MSTFDSLVADLTRDVHRAQPKDALQFCANWFQTRLEEQRARYRDILSRRGSTAFADLSPELYVDTPLGENNLNSVSPFTPATGHRHSYPHHRPSIHPSASPFGTLNVPGNALLSNVHVPPPPPSFRVDPVDLSPTSTGAGFPPSAFPPPQGPSQSSDGFLLPSSTIFARRTSVSAESIQLDGDPGEPLPVYQKTPEQLRRIHASVAKNFNFRDLDEEQRSGVLDAMQEVNVPAGEVVIRQGDDGDYFYVVESGTLDCFVQPSPLPPAAVTANTQNGDEEKFVQPGYHPEFGRKVRAYGPGEAFGELALMYGHPRAATIVAVEPCTLWRVDRITFRTIILKAAYRRRTMYEHFLSTVPLLSSLSAEERSKVADALTSKVYADGEVVVRQGEPGDTFFFVEEGEAVVTKKENDGKETKEIEVGRLRKGEYFGGEISTIEQFSCIDYPL